jgi:hypothetical protein
MNFFRRRERLLHNQSVPQQVVQNGGRGARAHGRPGGALRLCLHHLARGDRRGVRGRDRAPEYGALTPTEGPARSVRPTVWTNRWGHTTTRSCRAADASPSCDVPLPTHHPGQQKGARCHCHTMRIVWRAVRECLIDGSLP